jgi:hypothetical protein
MSNNPRESKKGEIKKGRRSERKEPEVSFLRTNYSPAPPL